MNPEIKKGRAMRANKRAYLIGMIEREFPEEARDRYLQALDDVFQEGLPVSELCRRLGRRQRELLGGERGEADG